MARPPKPIDVTLGHKSKEEIENRKNAEDSLRANDDKLKTAPSWLSKQAKVEYRKLYNEIKDLDVCSNLDINALAMIAMCLAKIKECEEIIAEEGMSVKVLKNGIVVTSEHPIIRTQLKYMEMLKKYMSEVNLFSPSGRSKLAIAKIEQDKNKQDPLLKILSEEDDCDEI